jgi:hypothetical protein
MYVPRTYRTSGQVPCGGPLRIALCDGSGPLTLSVQGDTFESQEKLILVPRGTEVELGVRETAGVPFTNVTVACAEATFAPDPHESV